MKKIIITLFVVLLPILARAQSSEVVLRQGTVNSKNFTLLKPNDNLYVTITDTGSTYTDSIYIYAVLQDPYREILLAGINQDTRQPAQILIPGANNTAGYNMPTMGTVQFRISFANAQVVSNRTTWITIIGTNTALGITVGEVTATISEPLEVDGTVAISGIASPVNTMPLADTSLIWATDTCIGVADTISKYSRYSIANLLAKFPNRLRFDITCDSILQVSTDPTFPAGATFRILAGESFGFENFYGISDIYVKGYSPTGAPVGIRRWRISVKGR